MNNIDIKKIVFIFVAIVCAFSLVMAVPIAQSRVIRVNDDTPVDNGDGSSWSKAIRSIEFALYQANVNDIIWVAQGEYRENVELTSGITLLGGFTAEGDARQITDPNNAFTTIIKAPARSGGTVLIMGEATKVEGFKIANGDNDGSDNDGYGGGIFCTGQDVKIIRNEICDNKALGGGGIGYSNGANPSIINNIIHDNIASNFGGGAIAAIGSRGTIIFNNITDNSTKNGGGAILCTMANPLIANNTIIANSSDKDGGAILCDYLSNPVIRNNVIARNSAIGRGGAIYCQDNSNASIINNTLYMDESINEISYGICSDSSSKLTILNSIIDNDGFPVVKVDTPVVNIQYSMLISYMQEEDPLFVDAENNDFRLDAGSPAKAAGVNGAELGAFGGESGGAAGPQYIGIGMLEVFDREIDCLQEIHVEALLSKDGLEIIVSDTQEVLASVDGGSGILVWGIETGQGLVVDSSGIIELIEGSNMLYITVSDALGKTLEETVVIIAGDTQPPVPSVATLPIITGQCFVEIDATQYPTAMDNCVEGLIIGTTTDSLIFDKQGTYTIVWTYEDENENTKQQTQTVIIADTEAPVPDAVSLPTVTGECSAQVDAVPTATDECCGPVIGTTTNPTSYDSPGTYTITWKFEDCNGKSITQNQKVIVTDTKAPVPDAVSLPTIEGISSAQVDTVPTATDECCGTVIGTTTDPTSYTMPGTYTITWKFEDCNGKSVTQKQTVIVVKLVDSTPPTVTASVDKFTVVQGASVTFTAIASDDTTSSNNLVYGWFEGTTKLGDSATLYKAFSTAGIHELRVEVTDEAGNKGSATVTVTVTAAYVPISGNWVSWTGQATLPWTKQPSTSWGTSTSWLTKPSTPWGTSTSTGWNLNTGFNSATSLTGSSSLPISNFWDQLGVFTF